MFMMIGFLVHQISFWMLFVTIVLVIDFNNFFKKKNKDLNGIDFVGGELINPINYVTINLYCQFSTFLVIDMKY